MSVVAEDGDTLWPPGVSPTDEFTAILEFQARDQGNLFVTGRAGTGKSTLLRAVAKRTAGQLLIAAPTGIAALNVGGDTLHSLFRLPRGLLIDGEEADVAPRDVFEVDPVTLIIDEASMVRADVMNAMDVSLRELRKSDAPFGNVRMIAFGDTHQLPPVSRRGDDAKLRGIFGGSYFFNAPAARSMRVIELSHVFRQKDERFVALLNEVREGHICAASLGVLNSRVAAAPAQAENWSWLCTTNEDAAELNTRFLDALPGPAKVYAAGLTGELQHSLRFDEDGTKLPAEKVLALKVGARVIFIRNDRFRRWVNGTKGVVTRLDDREIDVETENGETHTVSFEKWTKHRKVKVDKEIRDTEVGSMMQLPLRLGWAITIHKSQGMTLDRVFFNAPRRLFAAGQAYVALSRARSFEGLRLLRPLSAREVFVSPEALEYRRLLKPLIF
jgi:ATP-dependent exoDNAse (exonuclease V) alpha subunit